MGRIELMDGLMSGAVGVCKVYVGEVSAFVVIDRSLLELKKVLDEWKALDEYYTCTGDDEEWMPLSTWLRSQGLCVLNIKAELSL